MMAFTAPVVRHFAAVTFVLLIAGADRAILFCMDALCAAEAKHCCCPEEGTGPRECCVTGQSNESALVVAASRPAAPRAIDDAAPATATRFHAEPIRLGRRPHFEDAPPAPPLTLRI